MVTILGLKLLGHLRQRSRFKHVDDEHRVVGSQRASTLSNDVWMRNLILIGSIDKLIDTVVDVLLDGVVHRTLARG